MKAEKFGDVSASACADSVTDAVTHRRKPLHQSRTANPHAGINAADEKSVADLLSATGETGTA
nr:MAG TPA: hypothetical protein [Ackermannviridae sp.]